MFWVLTAISHRLFNKPPVPFLVLTWRKRRKGGTEGGTELGTELAGSSCLVPEFSLTDSYSSVVVLNRGLITIVALTEDWLSCGTHMGSE